MNKVQKDNTINLDVFTKNFKRHLALSGMRQIDVANAIGVSAGTITDWKRGRSYPRMDKIQALADLFGIQKSDLVEEFNVPKEAVSDIDQEVLDLFHQVPKEKREFILSMIRAATDNL